MGEVRIIASETVLDFIRRTGGVINTENVSQRFGWTMGQARAELRKLERQGDLDAPRLYRNPGPNGAILEWKIAPDAGGERSGGEG